MQMRGRRWQRRLTAVVRSGGRYSPRRQDGNEWQRRLAAVSSARSLYRSRWMDANEGVDSKRAAVARPILAHRNRPPSPFIQPAASLYFAISSPARLTRPPTPATIACRRWRGGRAAEGDGLL